MGGRAPASRSPARRVAEPHLSPSRAGGGELTAAPAAGSGRPVARRAPAGWRRGRPARASRRRRRSARRPPRLRRGSYRPARRGRRRRVAPASCSRTGSRAGGRVVEESFDHMSSVGPRISSAQTKSAMAPIAPPIADRRSPRAGILTQRLLVEIERQGTSAAAQAIDRPAEREPALRCSRPRPGSGSSMERLRQHADRGRAHRRRARRLALAMLGAAEEELGALAGPDRHDPPGA